ncbi:MAG: class I SAM-dependent methyltransferase [Bryobacterales bacterium]|nr:class I SAM-dependent methyltransferase [Bryobacterales bacterium]
MQKSSVDEIRARFDGDVERFASLETGHAVAMDAMLCLSQIAGAAARTTPAAKRILDVGCGAGNFTLRLRQEMAFAHATLLDLSLAMLTRARERVRAAGIEAEVHQRDLREVSFAEASFDVILAGAVLHHLRGDEEWEAAFRRFHGWLRPGGSLWVFDMVSHELPAVEALQRKRYTEYLVELGGEKRAGQVLAYIEKEDTPRPLTYQLDLMRRCGFSGVDVLHKNAAFAAFGGVRG